MSVEQFWRLVEESGSPCVCDPEEQCEKITEKLSELPLQELRNFYISHRQVLHAGYSEGLFHACFIMLNYISDDTFEDYINWLILDGRSRFEEALRNPDSIADFCDVDDPVEECIGEPLLYVCEEAYDGDIEDIESADRAQFPPNVHVTWPAVGVLQQKYPRLFERYWDEDNGYEPSC